MSSGAIFIDIPSVKLVEILVPYVTLTSVKMCVDKYSGL